MEMLEYSAGLMSQSVWFLEFKKMIQMVQDGKSSDEMKRICIEENAFGAPKPYRAKRMYGYLSNRLASLDSELVALFLSLDVNNQKIINLIAAMKSDRLLFEFVYEVYREKAYLGIDTLSHADINVFFREKAAQDEKIAAWSDSVFKHLRSNYTTFLLDSSMLVPITKKEFKITPPMIDISLEQFLVRSEQIAILKAITGVV